MAKECIVCGKKLGFINGEQLKGNICDNCFYDIAGNMEAILERENNTENYIKYYENIQKKIDKNTFSIDKKERLNTLFFEEISYSHEKRFGIGMRASIRIKEQKKEREIKHRAYAKSLNEFYEYDVVTIINENHGTVDKTKMMNILSEHARNGWRLHTMYSNELGKSALSLLGFGVNSTACEDVLIFERRIPELD